MHLQKSFVKHTETSSRLPRRRFTLRRNSRSRRTGLTQAHNDNLKHLAIDSPTSKVVGSGLVVCSSFDFKFYHQICVEEEQRITYSLASPFIIPFESSNFTNIPYFSFSLVKPSLLKCDDFSKMINYDTLGIYLSVYLKHKTRKKYLGPNGVKLITTNEDKLRQRK